MTVEVRPGDVLVVTTGHWAGWWVRLQARLLGKPARHDHVAVFSHIDAGGTAWVIEGRPSGVGWALASTYLDHPATVHNAAQPKNDHQRSMILTAATALLGTDYDWTAIAQLGAEVFRINALWRRYREWGEQSPPVAVICSSLADLAYEKAGLASPGGRDETRFTDVGDWASWIARRGWET